LISDASGGNCLVLGAGAFRGLAHAGVLRALRRAGIPIHSLIGCSIGGLVAAYHAGLGFDPDRIVEKLSRLTTAGLFGLGWKLRGGRLPASVDRVVEPLLQDLSALSSLDLNRLHFGIRRLGLLALDLPSGEEIFAATGLESEVPPGEVAIGGASIPVLYPAARRRVGSRTYRMVDGGFSHSVPVERAFDPPFSAHRVLAVDLQVIPGFREWSPRRWPELAAAHGSALLHLRPRVEEIGPLFFRADQAGELVAAGEAAVDDRVRAFLTPSPAGC
jgi:predicted acylesterase/phospholipase RssA